MTTFFSRQNDPGSRGSNAQCCENLVLAVILVLESKALYCYSEASITLGIVSRGGWLGNSANIKVEDNGAVGYVGSSLTVHNP